LSLFGIASRLFTSHVAFSPKKPSLSSSLLSSPQPFLVYYSRSNATEWDLNRGLLKILCYVKLYRDGLSDTHNDLWAYMRNTSLWVEDIHLSFRECDAPDLFIFSKAAAKYLGHDKEMSLSDADKARSIQIAICGSTFDAESWGIFDSRLERACHHFEVSAVRYVDNDMGDETNHEENLLPYLRFGGKISKEVWDAEWA
jgi:hypothetical protein